MPKETTVIEVRVKLFKDKKREIDDYCRLYHLDYQELFVRAVQEYIKYDRTKNSLARKDKIIKNYFEN